MVDDMGRKWVAVDLDLVAANYEIADYWSDVDANYGLDPDPIYTAPTQSLDGLDSTSADLRFRSWTFSNCNASPGHDMAVWNSESRIQFTSSSTSSSIPQRRKALVQVGNNCSGVLVATDVVLTAAHCVTSPFDGMPDDPTGLQVCSSDSSTSTCSNVYKIAKPSGWLGANNADVSTARHDYAYLRLSNSTPLISDPQMVMSLDSRNDIKKRKPLRVGFDGFRSNAAGNCVSRGSDKAFEHPATEVRGTRSGLLRMRADDAGGASGGPWFYESGGVCRVLALHTIARGGLAGTGFVGGPRVTEFRNWVIAGVGNR